MGIDFRSGTYRRHVRLGKRTIKDGEAAVIWSRSGRQREVIGPSLERLFFSHIRFLTRYTADPSQFLQVRLKNGAIERLRGPQTIFENPVHHDSVQVLDMLHVTSTQDCVVVYKEDTAQSCKSNRVKPALARKDSSVSVDDFVPLAQAVVAATGGDTDAGDGGNVRRRIVKGPSRYMPAVGEWVHEFKWSYDAGTPTTFTTLSTNKQTWEVETQFRTSDNCAASIALTIEFQVTDIEKVLLVSDPIASMRSALQADLAILGPKLQGHQLMSHVDSNLVTADSFSHMVAAASGAGLTVEKTVFRGFAPSDNLRAKMEKAAAAESNRREAATQAEARRQFERDEMDIREHRAEAEQQIADAEFANKQRQVDHQIVLQKQQAEHERSMSKSRREDTVAMLTSLRELGLDLTKYLCVESKAGGNSLPTTLDVRLAVAQALQLEGIGKAQ